MTDFCGHGSGPCGFLRAENFWNTWSQNPPPDFKNCPVLNKSPTFFGAGRFGIVEEEFLDCLTFEDGTDRLSRNVGN